jgi:hypothetical protein
VYVITPRWIVAVAADAHDGWATAGATSVLRLARMQIEIAGRIRRARRVFMAVVIRRRPLAP